MSVDKLSAEMINQVTLTIRFIDEILLPRPDVKRELLQDYKNILTQYLSNSDRDLIFKLREISSRPTAEGATYDFTEGMSLPLDGKYYSLGELVDNITDLDFQIESEK